MAKVFTITEGLENLGALKSGGQGSVYKARKTGEIITAIKILPTPIYSETEDDKHFTSFQNEVQKLKKVNEVPNPNVVSIIASGITSSGNLPYIEMEYIEGPDLGELLKPPYESVFTIKETIKVADQLANALAHCHRAGIKHGDIKSNNVKFNQHTGNYILLDFGLSVMSDEQRRTSIRYAGAIEFMAPEQSSGETLFETDIYSYGIILFELLAGTVPFPLTGKGEMARNTVMLAHMETLPPDIISLRRQIIQDLWGNDKQEREMHIPLWLLSMIDKCLEKNPLKRFRNGSEIQEFIHLGTVKEERNGVTNVSAAEPAIFQIDGSIWKKEIQKLQLQLAEKDELLNDLQQQVASRDNELYQAKYKTSKRNGVSKSVFFVVLLIAFGVAGFTAYNKIYNPGKPVQADTALQVNRTLINTADSSTMNANKPIKKLKINSKKNINIPSVNTGTKPGKKNGITDSASVTTILRSAKEYKIINTTYFYKSPDYSSKSDAYLTVGDATLKVLDETNEFVQVIFINERKKTTKGWLLKKDFTPANKY